MSGWATKVSRGIEAVRRYWRFGSAPPQQSLVEYSPQLDGAYSQVSRGLNLRGLSALLNSADNGNLADGLKLFQEMEFKDPHLHSVANTRRLSLTGLAWEVVSAADMRSDIADRTLADEAAEYTRETFNRLEGFDQTLEHLSTATGSNLAVSEMRWERCSLVRTVDVPPWRLRMDPADPGRVRVMTEDDYIGVPAVSPKFIVHIPYGGEAFPFHRSTLRTQAFVFLMKQLAMIDWGTFCAIFGMPTRWATYTQSATQEEKNQIVRMLEAMGTNNWAAMSEAVKLEFVECNRGTAPYEPLINWCDRKQTILMLGGNLTADTTGGTGTYAAGAVQDKVKDDLREDDIMREGRTIRQQVIAPLCAFAFGRREVPLPYFRRVKPETIDRIREAQLFQIATQNIGLKVGEAFMRRRLGIPKPEVNEPVIERNLGAFGETLQEGLPQGMEAGI